MEVGSYHKDYFIFQRKSYGFVHIQMSYRDLNL